MLKILSLIMKSFLLANPCKKIHCLNGGTCWVDNDITAKCDCEQGYGGKFCADGNYEIIIEILTVEYHKISI